MNNRLSFKKDLRLIGGGHSHVTVIKRMAARPIPGVKVTLISDDAYTPYSGMLPGLIAGHYSFDDCHIDLRKLCQWAGIQFVRSSVKTIQPEHKKIICHAYPALRYDLLSINIGSRPALECIQGARKCGYAVKPIDQFIDNWGQWITSLTTDSKPHVVVVGGGAAGVEVILAMQHRLQQVGAKNARFTLVCSDEGVLAAHNIRVQQYFQQFLQSLGVTLVTGKRVVSASEYKISLSDDTALSADFVAWAINAGAQPWLAESGVECDENGFVKVNQYLDSVSHPDIFAAGDCAAFTPEALPKAGVYAVRQGPILAKNLASSFCQRSLRPYRPQRRFLSLLSAGKRHAVVSWGNLFASGRWVWYWKNYIDRRFMARFDPIVKTPIIANKVNEDQHERMRCGGCGAKVSGSILKDVLAQLDMPSNRDIVGALNDDAAIIQFPEKQHLVQSVDFFRSFIDDPYLLGQIAANHSLSDIYAMGGIPHSALVTAVVPYGAQVIMRETLLHLMQGILHILNDEKVALIGGHSGEGPEVAVGLTANGVLQPGQALTKAGLLLGDNLILTKPLGSGVLLAAHMAKQCRGHWLDQALQVMLQSNRAAASIFRTYQVKSCTDVTGFGLLGHLREMLVASQCRAEVILNDLPIMDGAHACSALGIQSSLFNANRQSNGYQYGENRHPSYPLLFDPQTAGGLLAGVLDEHVDACLDALAKAGYTAANIGKIIKWDEDASITVK